MVRREAGRMNTLSGKVALVAGGTRGASRAIAVELGRAGAFVYVTGRTTRAGRSEVDRPETIEETAELVEKAGGQAEVIRVDHLVPAEVETLAKRIDRLDILVDGLWGGDNYLGWAKPVWEHDLEAGLRMIRLGLDAHLITSHFLLPLLIKQPGGLVVELTDGTAEYNAKYREGTSLPFYLAKASAHLLAIGEAAELAAHGATAVAFTPGYLRSEAMLEHYGVTEENWRDACERVPHFAISETPTFCGRTVVALASDPDRARWSGQTVSSGQLAKEYEVDDVDGSRPDAWRYMVEVADAGKPADVTGYR
ncbi:NAD(P)-dependent dehydrogenase, short-chain alcohol dehydrogenase family [Amycolatopsis tolypomycina]|uniref:NAD(P)-dependent dehydrogenase, short-chain alcohol dehydrogenase family n=2 Tax=Amycolatopsis tolypomycina TaxID=208445 RepID=A0A1H5DKR1_9PSEU|nr:NAD(P)-dependent dehydrogenase, short-chain alcohol dehydrogenase family [Amycolatopsis tolypomycina]